MEKLCLQAGRIDAFPPNRRRKDGEILKRMLKKLKISFNAASIIVGTIVGVGIFGLPYAIAKTGFLVGIPLLILLSGAVLCLHYLYGEIVLRTKRKQRLVGYAKKYLGSKGKSVASLSAIFGLLGSQLAYLIVGGEFLQFLSGNLLGKDLFVYIVIFLLIGSLVVLKDSTAIAGFEFLMSVFLILVILLIFFSALPRIQLNNFNEINLSNAFLAYGVILFSLSGVVAIPEAIEYLKKNKSKYHKKINYKKIIGIGTLLPHFLYILFIVATLGIVGNNISESAITSLQSFLGENVVMIGALFGLAAVITSFVTIGATLMKILWYDYRMPKIFSWLTVTVAPLILFVIGFRDFINVIGIVGAIMGGINGILIILIYQKAKKRGDNKEPAYSIRMPGIIKWGLVVVFVLGILYEFFYFLK